MLKDKKILLAVTSSISFYKSFEIISSLKKLGANVQVMLSSGVLKWINETPFEALSGNKVLSNNTKDELGALAHIDYAKVDLIVIAPATVNTINKLGAGICDDIFMETLIAASKIPTIIAPAANTNMLEHFATINSLNLLSKNGYEIIEPVVKTLACGDIGKGGLADTDIILYDIKRALLKDDFYKDKNIVITGGATTEKIDDVRGITNFSSGKMSKALADAFYYAGANVILISSAMPANVPYKTIKFENSSELETSIKKQNLQKNDLLIMAAAVSDYIPKNRIQGKTKKCDLGKTWDLSLKQNLNILESIKKEKFKKIGFKLETEKTKAIENAKLSLDKKKLDGVFLNVIDEHVKFGSENTKLTFISSKNKKNQTISGLKSEVALEITRLVKELFE